MRLNSSLALWLFSFHDILNDSFFSMTILVCLNCSERQSHQGKWWSYISLSDSFLSPYASRFTRWCRTLRVSDDALFLSDYSCLFSCLLGRVIKVMMINLFLCLTLFSTYASRGPTRETYARPWRRRGGSSEGAACAVVIKLSISLTLRFIGNDQSIRFTNSSFCNASELFPHLV